MLLSSTVSGTISSELHLQHSISFFSLKCFNLSAVQQNGHLAYILPQVIKMQLAIFRLHFMTIECYIVSPTAMY